MPRATGMGQSTGGASPSTHPVMGPDAVATIPKPSWDTTDAPDLVIDDSGTEHPSPPRSRAANRVTEIMGVTYLVSDSRWSIQPLRPLGDPC
eukprot:3574219-Prymnesium_polylepis.1